MTITQQNRYLDRPAPSSLADVIDTILDKGLVIDIYVRVSLVGIELLTIDARIVIASVDTYLRFAEAVNRLDLTETQTHGIPELVQGVTESGAKGKTSGAIEGAKEKLGSILGSDDEDSDKNADDEEDRGRKQPARRTRKTTSRQTKEKEE
ncbi:gas vesicle protein GvpJ [Nocardioides sp. YIM B13467]|uniref:gas vesicle protein GvpJ n=1 Tax=Nocardioides sp. YIM B13467 TaxID=3366294 RepID=UPI003672DB74